jgi:hypothetical protein
MRTRIVSLAVIGSMLCSSPAFAEDHANSGETYYGAEGMLIGSGVGILTGATAGVLACPTETDGWFHTSPAICAVLFGFVGFIPGLLVGGLIGAFIPKDSGPTALLVPSTNGRDTASLHLLVRF